MKTISNFQAILMLIAIILFGICLFESSMIMDYRYQISQHDSIINNYELLIDRIEEDIPSYVDDILCETDEWCNVYCN